VKVKAGNWVQLRDQDWLKYRESVRKNISIGKVRYRKVNGIVSVTATSGEVELLEER
jgi:hypothetical protein